MKNLYKTTALLLFLTSTIAHAQYFQWSKRGGSTNSISGSNQNNTNILEIATDAHDNVYIMAQAGSSNLRVDGVPLTGYARVGQAASIDIVISSFTASGVFRWAKVIGGESFDRGNSLRLDGDGNVYVAGRITRMHNSPLHFDTDTVLPSLNIITQAKFLVKYDSLGNYQWLALPGKDSLAMQDRGFSYRMDVDSDGRVHWFCYLNAGEHDWTNNNVIAEDGAYVLVYNGQGEVEEVIKMDFEADFGQFTGTWNDENFIYDSNLKRYYVGGYYPLATPFFIGGDTIEDRMYLAAFDSLGQVVWYIQGDSEPPYGNNRINHMTLDDVGNLYITGLMPNGGEFNGVLFDNPDMWFMSPFIMKIDDSGNALWAKYGKVDARTPSHGVAYNAAEDEVAIIGYSGSMYWFGNNDLDTFVSVGNQGYEAYIARFSPSNGDLIGMDRPTSPFGAASYGHAITADSEGAYYMGGNFSSMMYLGPDTLFKYGGQRSFFLSKYACSDPISDFNYTYISGSDTVWFSYTGGPADTLLWDFGDGHTLLNETDPHHVYAQRGKYQVCVTVINSCGTTQHCDSVDNRGLSTQEQRLLQLIEVYPNPTRDELHITNLTQHHNIQLYNTAGMLVKDLNTEGLSTTQIDVSDLPAGMYLLKIQGLSGAAVVRKVVVMGD
ncbi:MAG: T9SS type A sorting domain-containing protein [Cryomorphaceae bacterium]|nr:T9SS type A sorting domain-containing protein [Cryomorphaceae bacterium]